MPGARRLPCSIDIKTDVLTMWSSNYHPDTQWVFTDNAGHEHRYQGGYPSLDLKVDAEHWCNGDEGIAPHDPHHQIDASHYVCKICHETIQPGLLPPSVPIQIPGEVTATMAASRPQGTVLLSFVADLTKEEVDEITARREDVDFVNDFVMRFPVERMHWFEVRA